MKTINYISFFDSLLFIPIDPFFSEQGIYDIVHPFAPEVIAFLEMGFFAEL